MAWFVFTKVLVVSIHRDDELILVYKLSLDRPSSLIVGSERKRRFNTGLLAHSSCATR